jgi:glutamate dehydrogenase (NAD(P)+)
MESAFFSFVDELGPAKVIYVHQPEIGLQGVLVVDNVAAGPSIGGLRMAPDVTVEECFRLARAMTLKNAAAGLPHGGGKSVLRADYKMPSKAKEKLVRAFASALKGERDYIFGPDMGTDEQCMAWVKDEIGRSVGLPREVGGIPLDELGATGWGLLSSITAALPAVGLELAGARVAVQGFGSVGKHAARFLVDKGAVLVAASDSQGAVANPAGLDVSALAAWKDDGNAVGAFDGGQPLDPDDLISVDCDIWIPAARPDVINSENAERITARVIAQGANIPATADAERQLHRRGILCLPDFIANAGGVICAAMEYQGASQTAAFDTIAEKISANTAAMLKHATENDVLPRDAALALAKERVRAAMTTRRWSIF